VAYATAAAMTTGTPTPLPPSVATPTSPPQTPLLVYLDDLLVATATPTATPGATMPRELLGKVLFLSDREEQTRLYALDPANGRLAYLTEAWPYLLAKNRQMNSADGKYSLSVQERIDNIRPDDANPQVPGVFLRDNGFRTSRLLTPVNGWSFDPAFAPQGNRVVFVANEPGNDEIYTVDVSGANIQRLTNNSWEWDKHPTWSPDGSQILFWSNRESGRRQLWIMSADGKNQRPFFPSGSNDWDPVWVK
jgi:TolB protein